MTDEDLIDRLLYTGEGTTLDYKREGYVTDGSDDFKKSELLKDILAFSNTWRTEPAYILIGFDESEQEFYPVSRHPDDSRLQQFINGKTNKHVVFSYRAVTYKKQVLGLYTIEVQERPIYAKKKYGIVEKDVVYVRYGSSTAIADPTQIAKMGALEAIKGATGEPLLSVELVSIGDQKSLNSGISFAYTHLLMDEYPDYTVATHGYLKLNERLVNRNYYRDMALYQQEQAGAFGFRMNLMNRGTASANGVRVHLCFEPPGTLRVKAELEDVPSIDFLPKIPSLATLLKPPFDEHIEPDRLTTVFSFGKIHAGESSPSGDIFLITPSSELNSIQVRIHADELRAPIVFNVSATIKTTTQNLSFDELM